jgi:hypothetical protein
MKLVKFSLSHLRNEEHFQLMREVASLIKDAPETFKTKWSVVIDNFDAAVENEDAVIEKIRKSSFTDPITQLDKFRDALYHGIRVIVDAFTNSLDPSIVLAAKELKIIFDHYGSASNKGYAEESAMLYNLLQDLQAGEMHISQLGLTELINKLNNANTELESLVSNRNEETGDRTLVGTASDARKDADIAYTQLVTLLETEAMLSTAEKNEYIAFIARLNATLEKYHTLLAKRNARKPLPSSPDEDEELSEDGGGDDDDFDDEELPEN